MKQKNGLLIVVSGPAGSGKGTVLSDLIKDENYKYSVSATTRAPRPGEVDGVNYHFLTRESFEARIRRGEMLEWTEYCGNYYGTPKKEAEAVLASGCNLLLEIEVEGACTVKREYPQAVTIMLLLPILSDAMCIVIAGIRYYRRQSMFALLGIIFSIAALALYYILRTMMQFSLGWLDPII